MWRCVRESLIRRPAGQSCLLFNLHQDPRYFYKGKGGIRSRALYAISAAVIARGDDGRRKPNYSNVLGHFSAAAISNLYYPSSDRGASLVVFNGLAGIGEGAVRNLIRNSF